MRLKVFILALSLIVFSGPKKAVAIDPAIVVAASAFGGGFFEKMVEKVGPYFVTHKGRVQLLTTLTGCFSSCFMFFKQKALLETYLPHADMGAATRETLLKYLNLLLEAGWQVEDRFEETVLDFFPANTAHVKAEDTESETVPLMRAASKYATQPAATRVVGLFIYKNEKRTYALEQVEAHDHAPSFKTFLELSRSVIAEENLNVKRLHRIFSERNALRIKSLAGDVEIPDHVTLYAVGEIALEEKQVTEEQLKYYVQAPLVLAFLTEPLQKQQPEDMGEGRSAVLENLAYRRFKDDIEPQLLS